jgi:uncharacterized protein (DUF1684 family)
MKKCLFILMLVCFSNSHAQEKWTAESSSALQQKLNAEYADINESPLTENDFLIFKSLDFFPIDSKFAVLAKFTRSENGKVFKMKTTGARLPEYKKYGELHFTIDGQPLKLNVYQNIELSKKKGFEDYLFLPFSDLTSGKETYIGGRYIDMHFPKSDTVLIDFNSAYNPYCAYNHKYSCPLVPLENDLPIEIRAGVKKFHD